MPLFPPPRCAIARPYIAFAIQFTAVALRCRLCAAFAFLCSDTPLRYIALPLPFFASPSYASPSQITASRHLAIAIPYSAMPLQCVSSHSPAMPLQYLTKPPLKVALLCIATAVPRTATPCLCRTLPGGAVQSHRSVLLSHPLCGFCYPSHLTDQFFVFPIVIFLLKHRTGCRKTGEKTYRDAENTSNYRSHASTPSCFCVTIPITFLSDGDICAISLSLFLTTLYVRRKLLWMTEPTVSESI